MKKFIVIIFTAIVLMFTASCSSKVEKDIKAIVENEGKVCAVKSIDIEDNFYEYTEEYNRISPKVNYWRIIRDDRLETKEGYERVFEKYSDSREALKDRYEEVVKSVNESADSLGKYLGEYMFLITNTEGKIYVVKLRMLNEFTKKPNDYYSYAIFSYNEDETMHQVILDMDEFFRIVSSVYPKAIEDFKKAKAEAELIDDLLY